MNVRSFPASWIALILVASPIFAQKADSPALASNAQSRTLPRGPAPEGMVWIPGGEFSMGSDGKSDGVSCCSPATVADALPIHRVYVDGFWMDATDVTNAEFEKFVKATGYVTDRGARADQRRVSHGAAGKSCGWFHRLYADTASGAADQSLPVVALPARARTGDIRKVRRAT